MPTCNVASGSLHTRTQQSRCSADILWWMCCFFNVQLTNLTSCRQSRATALESTIKITASKSSYPAIWQGYFVEIQIQEAVLRIVLLLLPGLPSACWLKSNEMGIISHFTFPFHPQMYHRIKWRVFKVVMGESFFFWWEVYDVVGFWPCTAIIH